MNDQVNHDDKSKMFRWGKWVIFFLAVFLAVQTLGSLKNLGNIEPAYNLISVIGEGEVVSVPDTALFTFSISAEAKTVAEVQSQVTEKMNNLLAELKNLGIEEKDIKTTNYSIWPKYSYSQSVCTLQYPSYCPPGKQVLDGYTASHSVSLKVRKVDEVGKALALVGEKGATDISSVSFVVDDEEKLIEEARAKAIKNAREKARALADELDVRLVRVISFNENNSNDRLYYENYGMGGDAVKASSAPTLPAGENMTTISVTVTYEIR